MAMAALPLRLAVAGATGLLLLGGVAAAATIDNDSPAAGPAGPAGPGGTLDPSTTTAGNAPTDTKTITTALGPVTTTSPGPVTTSAGGTTSTTGAAPVTTTPRSSTTTRNGGPGQLVAAKPGVFGYDNTTGSDGAVPTTNRVSYTVEAAGTEAGVTLQDLTIPTEQFGQRVNIRNRVAIGPAGLVIRVSQADGYSCNWQPPWAQYVGGLKVGLAWSYASQCLVTVPIQGTVDRRGTRKVTGTHMLDAPGGKVATWTIDFDETTVITTGLGIFSVRSVGTEELAPSLGVLISKVEALSGTGVPTGSTSTLKLVTRP